MIDVRLPDGRVIKNVPDNMTKEELTKKLINNGLLSSNNNIKKPEENKMSKFDAILTQSSNPFGFGDEIVGALQAGYGSTIGKVIEPDKFKDKSFSDIYQETRDQIRQDQEQAKDTYPITSFISSLPSDMLGGGILLKGANYVKPVKKYIQSLPKKSLKTYAKQGAIAGALYGTGQAEKTSDIPTQALKSGSMGAIGGAVGGKIIEKTTNIANKIKDKFTNNSKSSNQEIENYISKNISRENLEKINQQIIQTQKKYPNQKDQLSIFENIENKELNKFIKNLFEIYPNSRQIVKSFAQNRVSDGYKRIEKGLNIISQHNISKTKESLKKASNDIGKIYQDDIYKKTFSIIKQSNVNNNNKNPIFTDEFKDIIDHTDFEIIKNDLNKTLRLEDVNLNSVQGLHKLRQAIDDGVKISDATGGIAGDIKGHLNKTKRLLDLREKTKFLMYQIAPDIKRADNLYTKIKTKEDLINDGNKFIEVAENINKNKDFKNLNDYLSQKVSIINKRDFKISNEQAIKYYQIGVKNRVINDIKKLTETSDNKVGKVTLNNSFNIIKNLDKEDIFKQIFNNDEKLQNFKSDLFIETYFSKFNQSLKIDNQKDSANNIEILKEYGNQILAPSFQLAIGNMFGKYNIGRQTLITTKKIIQKNFTGLSNKNSEILAKTILNQKDFKKTIGKILKNEKSLDQKEIIRKYFNNYGVLTGTKLTTNN